VGKTTGDAKLETEGKTQQTAGKIQNAVGGLHPRLSAIGATADIVVGSAIVRQICSIPSIVVVRLDASIFATH